MRKSVPWASLKIIRAEHIENHKESMLSLEHTGTLCSPISPIQPALLVSQNMPIKSVMCPTNLYPYLVGSGASSVVYRTSPEQVVKCSRPGTLDEIEHESDILERLGQHALIIKAFERETAGELILQYHPRELRDVLLSEKHICREKWALQITEALAYVHDNNIIHCDVNSRNIRIQTSGDIVLCDFAGSSLVDHIQRGVRAEVGAVKDLTLLGA